MLYPNCKVYKISTRKSLVKQTKQDRFFWQLNTADIILSVHEQTRSNPGTIFQRVVANSSTNWHLIFAHVNSVIQKHLNDKGNGNRNKKKSTHP